MNNLYKMTSNEIICCEEKYNHHLLFVCDKTEESNQKVESHVELDDYFGTLATIVHLITESEEEALNSLLKIHRRNQKFLREIKENLMFLHKNYKIKKR